MWGMEAIISAPLNWSTVRTWSFPPHSTTFPSVRSHRHHGF